MYTTSNTIVALATPNGEGAIGIIRLSGDDAISIVQKMWKGKNLLDQPSHSLHYGKIVYNNQILDEAVVSLYKNPRSYTGEDIVEISCHGSRYILEQVIQCCLREGATMAMPGEFTQRAFLNGKMDLTQAEAVADLIASESKAAHHAAMHNLRGGFSLDLQQIREDLISFSALIELELDFSEEDVTFADRSQLLTMLENAKEKVQKLLHSFQLGNVIKHGIKVALIGKPNAGKSTLLNALLNEERAIVSEIAGTTRDTIEESLNINGVQFRLIDTAGIREHTADVIESIGIERSKKAIEEANVVVYLMDLSTLQKEDFLAAKQLIENNKPTIFVGTKADLLVENFNNKTEVSSLPHLSEILPADTLLLSAKHNGAQELKEILFSKMVGENINTEETIITNTRHFEALKEVMQCLDAIQIAIHQNIPGDLLSLDIRRCLHYLGLITGTITNEDKLDYIFSKFCIGK